MAFVGFNAIVAVVVVVLAANTIVSGDVDVERIAGQPTPQPVEYMYPWSVDIRLMPCAARIRVCSSPPFGTIVQTNLPLPERR